MTWKKIKNKIESSGVKDEDNIIYIDITFDMSLVDDIVVEDFGENKEWSIHN